MGCLRNAQPGTPGFSHFPADRQQPYFEQPLGEALVTTYSKGQPLREWGPLVRPNSHKIAKSTPP